MYTYHPIFHWSQENWLSISNGYLWEKKKNCFSLRSRLHLRILIALITKIRSRPRPTWIEIRQVLKGKGTGLPQCHTKIPGSIIIPESGLIFWGGVLWGGTTLDFHENSQYIYIYIYTYDYINIFTVGKDGQVDRVWAKKKELENKSPTQVAM